MFTKENCQIWCRNPILPKFKANNFSIIMTKGIKMAWIIMWHDVSSYLNQSKIRKSKIDKSDLLDTIGPLESVCGPTLFLKYSLPPSQPHICYWRRAELKGGEDFISARDPSQFQYDDVPQMLHLPHVPLAKVDRNQVCMYNSMYVIQQPWVSMPKI